MEMEPGIDRILGPHGAREGQFIRRTGPWCSREV